MCVKLRNTLSANRKLQTKVSVRKSDLAALFPAALNFWPILLFISQKALPPIWLILIAGGDRQYRRDWGIVLIAIASAILLYILQIKNEFSQIHLVGYITFLISIPIINYAIRKDAAKVLYVVAYVSVINAIIGITIYISDFDMTAFRGLNKMVGNDGAIHRVYFESASLLSIFTLHAFRKMWQRVTAAILVATYALFLAKSFVVIALFAVNTTVLRLSSSNLKQRVATIGIAAIITMIAIPFIQQWRPDILLSLGAKWEQLTTILNYQTNVDIGLGWGYVIDSLVNNVDQPYQIEMQLPMLFVQTGVIGTSSLLITMYLLQSSTRESIFISTMAFAIYIAIGFNNPWLLIPSWYLTTALLFRKTPLRCPKRTF